MVLASAQYNSYQSYLRVAHFFQTHIPFKIENFQIKQYLNIGNFKSPLQIPISFQKTS